MSLEHQDLRNLGVPERGWIPAQGRIREAARARDARFGQLSTRPPPRQEHAVV